MRSVVFLVENGRRQERRQVNELLGLEDNDCFSLNISKLGRYGRLTGKSRFFNLSLGENAFQHGDTKRQRSRDNDRN